ncbi:MULTISPECIES: GTP 3',8-cyclase MoaA [Psychrobacillus]|uniref:GTP 3',8-cyclase MoaA n=1 Tax=Psychrobacillus TaxID=1221880 RepID=UPI0008EE20E8|nr:GTP 3',8-cyclase MoaA [Psychrobacillus psychrodurans]MCZ8540001.1 GTP 3',8-cyclase MoaA [Psychrobacillus psychrodurans]SFM52406.1 cyclic pyranopterin phosphate synthase [Psychrobacillus psychrodurans]
MSVNILQDRLYRPMKDLRISVTDRCNFRCSYCMPKEIFGDDYVFLPREELLTFEEMERLAKIFESFGVRKIRLTGGEPLMRRNIDELVKKLLTLDNIKDVGLTTNGVLLKQYGQKLKDAGLTRLNISLDALDENLFGNLNGRGIKSSFILENIQFAQNLGFEVKVNMVVQKNENDQEIIPMAKYFKEQGITLRFIEFMDVGNDNAWSFEKVITKKQILTMLQQEFDLEPVDKDYFGEVAERYRYVGTESQVGFITSVSESFCSSCTRARLSSDGKFYTCLFATNGFDLRELIRNGATDDELSDAIKNVWELRTDRYSDERTEETAKNRTKINMSYIGG